MCFSWNLVSPSALGEEEFLLSLMALVNIVAEPCSTDDQHLGRARLHGVGTTHPGTRCPPHPPITNQTTQHHHDIRS